MEYQHQPIAPLAPPPPPQLLPPAPPPPLPSLPQLQPSHAQDDDRWNQYHIWRQHVFVNGQSPPRAARALSRRREEKVRQRPPDIGRNFSLHRELFVSAIWDFLRTPSAPSPATSAYSILLHAVPISVAFRNISDMKPESIAIVLVSR